MKKSIISILLLASSLSCMAVSWMDFFGCALVLQSWHFDDGRHGEVPGETLFLIENIGNTKGTDNYSWSYTWTGMQDGEQNGTVKYSNSRPELATFVYYDQRSKTTTETPMVITKYDAANKLLYTKVMKTGLNRVFKLRGDPHRGKVRFAK